MGFCEVCGGPCDNKYSACQESKDCRSEYRRRSRDAALERLRLMERNGGYRGYRSALRATVQRRARKLFFGARWRAQECGLPFDLTAEWAESELAFALENGCPLLGVEVILNIGPRVPGTPTIDRFRPELGYVQDNCWILSWAANNMKHGMTLDFARKVVALAEAVQGRGLMLTCRMCGGCLSRQDGSMYCDRTAECRRARLRVIPPTAPGPCPDVWRNWSLRGKAASLSGHAGDRARRDGLPFDLTVEWAERELASAIANGCPLLGIEVRLDAKRVDPGFPTIDRLDPGRGYAQENCWVISHRANVMKQNATPDFMRRILEAAATRFTVDPAA